MRRLLALAFVVACGAGQRPRTETRSGDLVITDVTVVPMDRDGALAHHSVVVRGDRIVAVAPNERIAIAPGATRIDGAGKWLMPGLADMHVHTWSPDDLTLFVAAGVTTVRNMFGAEQHLAWRDQIARGELVGPTIVTASPIIDGDPPVWPGSIVLTQPADADRIVGELKAKGYDFLKPYSRLSREAYDALVAAGKHHGMALAGHVPRAAGLARVLAAKQQTIEHLDGWLLALVPDGIQLPEGAAFWAKFRDVLPRLDRSRLPALVAQTIAAGTWNCPTLIVLERMAALRDLPAVRARSKWLDKVAPAIVAQWDPAKDFRLKAMTPEDFDTMRRANAERGTILAALAAAGAPLIAGTDTGNPFVIPGEALHDELELMIAAGVPRAQALRAATANPAEMLGKRGDFGVVAPGGRADLLLVSTDPLAGPLALVPDGVVLRGKWLPRSELEAKLGEIGKAAAATGKRWDGVPPLPVEGKPVHEAHYDLTSGGKSVGEERLAITVAGGKPTIVAQSILELPVRIEVTYTLGPDATTLAMKSSFGSLELTAKVTGGKLEGTGTARGGKSLALSKPMPAGAFLSGPGIGGSFHLAEALATLPVGDRRALVSLELAFFPKVEIAEVHYDVVRKPDSAGRRVYTVASQLAGSNVTGELVLDADGRPVSQTFGPPLDLTFERR